MRRGRFKRLGALVLTAALMTGLLGSVRAVEKGVDIYINGDLLNIPPSFGEPFYDSNKRLQSPMRYIIESCGYDVVWNSAQQTATIPTKDGDVVITLGSSTMTTPRGNVAMDTNAMAKDNRTYIPLRFALEALGFKVVWSGGAFADTVSITGEIGAGSKRVPMTAAEVSKLASPAVFYIEVSDLDGVPFARGSGFFIDPSGVGVTNYHVIEGAYNAMITTVDGAVYQMGMVLYYDKERDIAVFDALPTDPGVQKVNVPYLNLATPSSIHNGDVAYAIGSPLGLQNSITDGLVSNKDRILPGETLSYIQTSAPISHGNSGGPLLNQFGEVIGVNAAILTEGQNLNLAVPVSDLARVDYNNQANWMFLFEVADREQTIAPPTNIRIVGKDAKAVLIQWDPVEGADYYHFYYQEAGEDSFWYDEDDGGPIKFYWDSDYTVEYHNLTAGKTYNVIVTSVKDGLESQFSKTFTFSFSGGGAPTPSAPAAGGIPFYKGAYWAPDFGAITGAKLVYSNSSGGFYHYVYSDYDFAEILHYGEVLMQLGYAWNGDTTMSGMFYYNAANGHGILLSYSVNGEYMVSTE